MSPLARIGRASLLIGPPLAAVYVLLWRGSLTLDLGVGRRVRPLGPMHVAIAAKRERVFDVIAAPYLGRTPKATESKLKVLERGSGMVLADHRTPVGRSRRRPSRS